MLLWVVRWQMMTKLDIIYGIHNWVCWLYEIHHLKYCSIWRCPITIRLLYGESWCEDIACSYASTFWKWISSGKVPWIKLACWKGNYNKLSQWTRTIQVLYPELPSHPQHAIHKKQSKGMSGMVSFYLKGGMAESEKFLKALKVVHEYMISNIV